MSANPDIALALDTRHRNRIELRAVIAMTVPMVITNCSRMVMDLADFIMISHLPAGAASAQSAILPAQITTWTFMVPVLGTAIMVNTFVSQCLGRGEERKTGAYAWQAVYMGLAYGVVAIMLLPWLADVFALFHHGAQVQAEEVAYAQAALFTVGPTIAGEALASFFNGIHKPRVTMWTAVEANAVNIAVSCVLIFGLFGVPAMGIAGAAWGTVVGVTYRLVRLGAVFLSRDCAASYGTRESYAIDWRKLRRIIRVGFPQGLQWTSDVFVWMIFITTLIGRTFGDTELLASNVAWQYMRTAFMPAFGVGFALTALVGKAIGQRDPDQAVRHARVCVLILLAYMGGLSFIYLVFRAQLIGLFNANPEVIRIGSSIMICATLFLVFDGVGICYNCALRGAGDTLWPAVLFIVSHWLVLVGGGYLASRIWPQWGSIGPWSAGTVLITFLGIALWLRWRGGAWKKLDIFKDGHPAEPEPAIEPSIAPAAAPPAA